MTEVRDMKKGREMRPYPRFGGDGGTRTHDLCVANASLYQLSYVPEVVEMRGVEPLSE